MTKIIDGKKISEKILKILQQKVQGIRTRPPGIAFILVGNHLPSQTYVRMKKKRCQEVGFFSQVFALKETVSKKTLLSLIARLNKDSDVDGILLQMPLPKHLDSTLLTSAIAPEKDVDGFHPINMGKLLLGRNDGFIPCTPFGILQLLVAYKVPLEGKHIVIVGRSNIVGKPLAALLMQKKEGMNGTVTVAHSRTKSLQKLCKTADILIAAIGQPHFIKKSFIKKGAIVIDVGISQLGKTLVGDVSSTASSKTSLITPVPGGVGPMTIAMLLYNTYLAYCRKIKKKKLNVDSFNNTP